MLETPSSGLYLLGNIQTGKSKKQFQPSYAPRAGSAVWTEHSSYLWKEHQEGKKSEKILVPVHFSGARRQIPSFADYSVARLHPVLGFDLFGLSLQKLPPIES